MHLQEEIGAGVSAQALRYVLCASLDLVGDALLKTLGVPQRHFEQQSLQRWKEVQVSPVALSVPLALVALLALMLQWQDVRLFLWAFLVQKQRLLMLLALKAKISVAGVSGVVLQDVALMLPAARHFFLVVARTFDVAAVEAFEAHHFLSSAHPVAHLPFQVVAGTFGAAAVEAAEEHHLPCSARPVAADALAVAEAAPSTCPSDAFPVRGVPAALSAAVATFEAAASIHPQCCVAPPAPSAGLSSSLPQLALPSPSPPVAFV